MNEMVERAAIALYSADGYQRAIYPTGAAGWLHDREDVRERYRARARAVIEAIAIPSQNAFVLQMDVEAFTLGGIGFPAGRYQIFRVEKPEDEEPIGAQLPT